MLALVALNSQDFESLCEKKKETAVSPLRCSPLKNISTRGPRNCRSLGYARDDKGKGNGLIESGCWTEAFFSLGGAKRSGEIWFLSPSHTDGPSPGCRPMPARSVARLGSEGNFAPEDSSSVRRPGDSERLRPNSHQPFPAGKHEPHQDDDGR